MMPRTTVEPGLAQIALILLTIVAGLAIDTQLGLFGQLALSAIVWTVFFLLLAPLDRAARLPLFACLLLATAGEVFLSLVWGLYTYRLDNIPLFVPPGHVLLFLLGVALARRLSEAAAVGIIAVAGVASLGLAVTGIDTLGLLLFALLLLTALALPQQRRLYASTFVLALLLELVGTAFGNWSWAREVPGLPAPLALVTTNPPLAAGAFYSALDALVAATVGGLLPAWRRLMPPRLAAARADD